MDFSEMTAAFLEELEEQLENLEQGILQIERSSESDAEVQELFRAAHSIKGAAAVMEFDAMKHLTHHMEYVLDEVRSHRLRVEKSLVDLLFESLDKLRELRDEFATGSTSFQDVSPLVARLEGLLRPNQEIGMSVKTNLATPPADVNLSVRKRIEEYLESGYFVARIEVTFTPDVLLKSARAKLICNALDEVGDVLHVIPDIDDFSLEDDHWGNLIMWFATRETPDAVSQIVANCGDVANVELEEFVGTAMPKDSPQDTPQYQDKHPVANEVEAVSKSNQPQTIRVDVQRLENIMNLVGELVIDRTQVQVIGNDLGRQKLAKSEVKNLESVTAHMARIVGELQENVMHARMLPIERVFNRFPRMVRSLASQLGKEIILTLEGQETQLDRTLIDEIADPLIHLIRNAVDHGIEGSSVREKNGKATKGNLRIAATHQENHILIVVEDDGAGIHPEKMRQSAIQKGLISKAEAEALTDTEAQHLIFRPGFSTAAQVTDVSGRGVGMDIVRANIEKLQGFIEIFSQPGVGTRFEIKLPLTLAIVRGLLVGVGKDTFVVPIASVAEIIRENVSSIQSVNGHEVIRVRGQTVPVRWLHDEFGIERPELHARSIPVVIAGLGNQKIGFVVDELKGNQEIVKKSLGHFIGTVRGISGCTILGNGSVAMILDVVDLCKRH